MLKINEICSRENGGVVGMFHTKVEIIGPSNGSMGDDAIACVNHFLSPEQQADGWEVGICGDDADPSTSDRAVYFVTIFPPGLPY